LSEGISALRYLFENLLGKQYLASLRVYIQHADLSQRSGGWQCQPDRHTPQQTSPYDQAGAFPIEQVAHVIEQLIPILVPSLQDCLRRHTGW
jgi:hypothetical protein